MSRASQYKIRLLSDAEPASGFGGELMNSLVPRDAEGRLSIPSTHLKGVMRESLFRLLSPLRKDASEICAGLFGSAGESGGGGQSGVLHITDAVAPEGTETLSIVRTRLEDGRAADKSLRANEALPKGTVLSGSFSCGKGGETIERLAALALMSVSSLGGGRTRGAGACQIKVEGFESETPGSLLRSLCSVPVEFPSLSGSYTESGEVGGEVKALRLEFHAESPVCLPVHPVGGGNVITSGYAIAGTAVMGTLLNLLSEGDSELASACYRSPKFRCYPLLPVPEEGSDGCIPLLVSNTHRISKLPQGEQLRHLFGDTMIPDEDLSPDYHWQKRSAHISMKGASGMLIVGSKSAPIGLLRDSEIPRYYSAHGVVNGSGEKSDNLYTMESVCVKSFAGIVILPSVAAERLLETLGDGRQVSFGKAKTTQGNGVLKARVWAGFEDLEHEYPQVEKLRDRLFIVQSPIVYDADASASTREVMAGVLRDGGWGELEKESVLTGVLFGWNRLRLDGQINGTEQVKAKRVIMPGSVFLLKAPLADLKTKLTEGLGSDRRGGYGAVMPHPMFATELCHLRKEVPEKRFAKAGENPVYCGYRLHNENGGRLSPSQIARLMRCVQISIEEARDFLNRQKSDRPEPIWECWKGVYGTLEDYLRRYGKSEMEQMLRVWHDLEIVR
ncbi:MAG: hypothetical protein IJS15_11130 [Victivallales bacterium]|nr:hypothetical protein [Victivallales bacterium]